MFSDSVREMNEAIKKAFGFVPPREETAKATEEALNGVGYVDTDSVQEKDTDVPEEEWIWVTGYKGMDKDMQCHGGFQYELGKRYDMPEKAKIEACSSGYHLCLTMHDVFSHVVIYRGNRFFEVRALVRKKDFDEYGKVKKDESRCSRMLGNIYIVNKLAAKSIEIVRELSVDEIMEHVPEAKYWSDEYKKMAITTGIDAVRGLVKINELEDLGYSNTFAHWLVNNGKYDIAKAVGSQEGLSMDMKVLCIMTKN